MTTSSLCGKPDDDLSRKSWTVKDWYTHVGAWENDRGQLCFGSTIAFSAMLTQFHRVHTASTGCEVAALGLTLAVLREAFNAPDSEVRVANIDMPAITRRAIEEFEPVRRDHSRLNAEVSALQQRLNIADQRVCDLTAERDGLKAEVERIKDAALCAWHDLGQSQALMRFAVSELRNPLHTGWEDDLANRLEAELAHQSAPAAKCGRCDASTVERCDEKGCGYLGAGNGEPAVKGGSDE